MIYTLGNLIVDILLYIESFPVRAKALQGVSHVAIGPGGACNVAIMAARFSLPVACLGEVGDDYFGQIVVSGLEKEGIDTRFVAKNEGGATPIAGVLVDADSEPGYLGYPGIPILGELPVQWRSALREGEALFVDGWIEYPEMADIALDAMRTARGAGVMTFFDPGPGNPRQDNKWHQEAARLATVVLANEPETLQLSGTESIKEGASALLANGASLVVVKRGSQGCVLFAASEVVEVPGLPVEAVDTTGAGDSLTAAVMYGCLQDLSLADIGLLANVTGAAKVMKVGTGHQLPTTAEIRSLLERFDLAVVGWR